MTQSVEYKKGYSAGYQAGRRGRPSAPKVSRARYSKRVHERLLAVHAKRWEAMHAYRRTYGDDATYRELRSRMIDARRAVDRYCVETAKVRRG
jgi:hypothetical protein